MLFTLARSAAPTRVSSPLGECSATAADNGIPSFGLRDSVEPLPQQAGSQISTPSSTLLSNARRVEYLKNYVGEVAPWLDMFDSQCTFRIQLPAMARSFPPLFYAILAISARQMERRERICESFDSLELYQHAIRLLSPLLQVSDAKVVAACVVLCCLEMMSARAQDWRRHLEGCAALFDSFGIHGFSPGVLRAVFWCYARMDLCGALISDGTQSTLLKPAKWLPTDVDANDSHRLFQETDSPDMYANYAVYLGARVTELVADRTRFVELGEDSACAGPEFQSRWLRLWDELQSWLSNRPTELVPVETTNVKPFPHILFVHWAAISSNQLYHTACVLILNIMPKTIRLPPSSRASPLWHARRICGISLTNPHHGCLNNAVQPLWIAGRLFSHPSEHELIIRIFEEIEASSGWGATWRIRDLEEAWGYEPRWDERPAPGNLLSAVAEDDESSGPLGRTMTD